GKGHFAGSLQACSAAPLIRQPVSPRTKMRWGLAIGSGSAVPAISARDAPVGIATEQAREKSALAAARTVIATSPLSVCSAGHAAALVTSLASKPAAVAC